MEEFGKCCGHSYLVGRLDLVDLFKKEKVNANVQADCDRRV